MISCTSIALVAIVPFGYLLIVTITINLELLVTTLVVMTSSPNITKVTLSSSLRSYIIISVINSH